MKLISEIGYWVLVGIFIGATLDAASLWLECLNPRFDIFIYRLLLLVPTFGLGVAAVGAAATAIIARRWPDGKLRAYVRLGAPIVLALIALLVAILVDRHLGVVKEECLF